MSRAVYRTWIPRNAKEVIEERYPSGAKWKANYFLRGKKVGSREWYENGQLDFENAHRDGQRHGNEYRFYENGQMLEVTPYRNNQIHGTGKQWAEDGRLVITYRLVRNVGLDLWCGENDNLTEEHYWPKAGELGYRRNWNGDDRTIYEEYSWILGKGYHGIWRAWNQRGRFRRGYPKYYVADQQVTKRQYLRLCLSDPSLPKYRAKDDKPQRKLPAEYVAQRRNRE